MSGFRFDIDFEYFELRFRLAGEADVTTEIAENGQSYAACQSYRIDRTELPSGWTRAMVDEKVREDVFFDEEVRAAILKLFETAGPGHEPCDTAGEGR